MKMDKIIIVICFSIISINCAPLNEGDGKIVGGSLAQIQSFPYQLSLRYNARHMCGAAIISPKYALTAAHCIEKDMQLKQTTLKSGTSSLFGGGKIHKLVSAKVHPKFDEITQDYDAALLEVSDPFVVNARSAPIDLPVPGYRPEIGSKAVVSGWGVQKEGQIGASINLRYVTVPFVSIDECIKSYKKYGDITPRMICAGYAKGEKDACQGDSGGPLVENGVLVGIVSWGAGCARPGLPGIYTRLSDQNIRDWIKNSTGV